MTTTERIAVLEQELLELRAVLLVVLDLVPADDPAERAALAGRLVPPTGDE